MSASFFLDPADPLPGDLPVPPQPGRRRLVMGLVLAAGLLGLGAAFSVHRDNGVAAPKPGPRRYPPAYWGEPGR